ncbi:hypothetical protein E1I18_02455 [Mycoplasmopsis mucosicanis]|uniref:SGNH hydrolase-type esterase domain-containing protein n=1 Tax=Mycoplasmopsis mucosicanis TaxID=458208 RepID=A0A507SPX3_9BACT|nr:SGNH/GDSL hydrolase family protein [Mycoplasmopsis mucosicanis]TQC51422.1 hypothetical protein E1I18_02455 [Mycoplasmopsis mucosicanis]
MRKNRVKNVLISLAALGLSVTLATTLSLIPTQEKKLKESSQVVQNNNDDQSSSIPELPKKDQDESKSINNEQNQGSFLTLSPRLQSPNLIAQDKKINYLAFGDSITAGFVAKLDNDYPGSFDNGKVSGLSYPAYLAYFFNQIDRLGSFKNHAVSGSTFVEWDTLLKFKNPKFTPTVAQEAILKARFGENWKQKAADVIEKTKSANLLTISLGANDFLHTLRKNIANFPFSQIIEIINNKRVDYPTVVKLVNGLFKEFFDSIEKSQSSLIQQIRELNKDVNINFIGFPTPMTTIFDMVDRYISKDPKNSISISSILIDLINKKIKFTANNHGVYYLNPFDYEYWTKNNLVLTDTLFDIHPGIRGYKKIALDLFIKLTTTNRNQAEFRKNNINWSKKYLTSDQDSFLTQISLNNSEFSVYEKLFSKDLDNFILQNDELRTIAQSDNKFNDENYKHRVLELIDLGSILFDQVLPGFFESDFYKEIDEKGVFKNFLFKNNAKNYNSLRNWFKENKIIADLLFSVEKTFREKDWDNDGKKGAKVNKLEYLFAALKSEFGNEQKIIKWIFSLSQTSVFKEDLQEFKSVSKTLLTNLISHKWTKSKITSFVGAFYNEEIEKYISKNDISRLISLVLESDTFKQNIVDIIGNIIEDSQKYGQSKSFEELWFTFINNKKTEQSLRNIIKFGLNDLVKNPEFKAIASRVITNLFKSFPEIFEGINTSEINVIAQKLISGWDKINTEFSITNILTDKFLEQLRKQVPTNFNTKEFIGNLLGAFDLKFNKENIDQTILKIIKNFSNIDLNNHSETLQKLVSNTIRYFIKRPKNIENISNYLYKLLQNKIGAYVDQKTFYNLVSNIFTDDNFEQVLQGFVSDLNNIKYEEIQQATSLKDLIRKLLKNSKDSHIFEPLIQLVRNVLDSDELETLLKNIQSKLPREKQKLNLILLRDLISEALETDGFKELLFDFVFNGIFGDEQHIADISFDGILHTWLSTNLKRDQANQKINTYLSNLFANQDFIDHLAEVIYQNLLANTPIAQNIEKEKLIKLLSDGISSLSFLTHNSSIIQNIVSQLTFELSQNGTKVNWALFAQKIQNSVFNGKNIDNNFVKIIEALNKNDAIGSNKETLAKLLINSIKEPKNLEQISASISSALKTYTKDLITQQEITALLQKLLNENEAIELLNSLIDSLSSLKFNKDSKIASLFDLTKAIYNNTNKELLSEKILLLVGKLVNYEELNPVFAKLFDLIPGGFKGLDKQKIKLFVVSLVKTKAAQKILTQFLSSAIFGEKTNEQNIKDFNTILKNALSDAKVRDELKQNIAELILSGTNSGELSSLTSDIIYAKLQSFNIANKINKNQLDSLISDLFKSITEINSQTHLIDNVSAELVEQLAKNGTNIDVSNFTKTIVNSVFKGNSIDQSVLQIIKILASQNILQKHSEILRNLLEISLPSLKQALIQNNYLFGLLGLQNSDAFTAEKFNSLVNKIFELDEFKSSFNSITNSLLNIDNSTIQNSHSVLELLKHVLVSDKNTDIFNNFFELLLKIADFDEVKEALDFEHKNWAKNFKNVNRENVLNFAKHLLQSQSLRFLVKDFVQNALLNEHSKLDKITDINFLFKQWFSDAEHNKEISQKTIELLKDLVNSDDFVEIITDLIWSQLSTRTHLSDNITRDNIKSFVSDIFNTIKTKDDKDQLFNNIVVVIQNYFNQNNSSFSLIDLTNSIGKSVFKANSVEELLNNILKELVANKLFNNHKDLIKNVFINTLKYLPNDDKFVEFITLNLGFSLENKESIKTVLTRLANEPEFNSLIEKLIHELINIDEAKINKSKDIVDLIRTIYSESKSDTLYKCFVALVNKVFDYDELKPIFTKLNTKLLGKNDEQITNDLKEIVKYIVSHDSSKSLIDSFIKDGLLAPNTKLSQIISIDVILKHWLSNGNKKRVEQTLTTLITDLLKQDKVQNLLVHLLNSQLNEQNNQDTTNKIKDLIKDIFTNIESINKDSKIIDKIVTEIIEQVAQKGTQIDAKKLIESILKIVYEGDSLEKSIINIVKSLAKHNLVHKHSEILKFLVKKLLVKLPKNEAFLLKIYQSFGAKASEFISQADFVKLVQKVFSTTEATDFVDSFIDHLAKIDSSEVEKVQNYFDLIKLGIKGSTQSVPLSKFIKFIKKSLTLEEVKPLFNNLVSKIKYGGSILEFDNAKALIEYFLDQNELEVLLANFIEKGIFADEVTQEKIGDFDFIIKNWLKSEDQKKLVKDNLNKFFDNAIKNNGFTEPLTKVIVKFLKSDELLGKDITEEQIKKLVSDILNQFSQYNQSSSLTHNLVESLVDELSKNGTHIDTAALTKNTVKSVFDFAQPEISLLNLLKRYVNSDIIKNNIEVLKQLAYNIVAFLPNQRTLFTQIYQQLDEPTGKRISKHLSEEEFKTIFRDSFVSSKDDVIKIFEIALKGLSDTKTASINSISELVNIVFENKENRDHVASALENIVSKIFGHKNLYNLLHSLWKENIEPYGVDVNDPKNVEFSKSLFNELPELIKKLKIVPHLVEALFKASSGKDKLSDFGSKFAKQLLTELDLGNYNLVKTLLESKTLKDNKQILIDDISKVIMSITSNDQQINKFINDFGLSENLQNFGISQHDATKTLQDTFKSNELKQILNTFINEIINNSTEYAELDSWPVALSKFFKSNNAQTIKEHLKTWIKNTITNNDSISEAVGKILAKLMQDSEIKFPEDKVNVVQKFVKSLLKQAVNTRIVNDVIDEIFTTLQKLENHKIEELPTLMQNALIKGATKFISNDKGVILLGKIFQNSDVFKQIFEKIDAKAYSDFINLIFQYSPQSTNKGIYATMFGDKSSVSFDAFSGIGGILNGDGTAFVRIFVSPLVKAFFEELNTKDKYKDINDLKKNSDGYKALWRFYAFFSQIMYNNVTPKIVFWNRTAISAEKVVANAYKNAFEDNIKNYSGVLNKYSDKKDIIGFNKNSEALDDFIAGYQVLTYSGFFSTSTYRSRSSSLSDSFYGRDHTLVYIYYGDTKDTKYNKTKTKKQVLLEDMIKGYQPVETK